MNRNPTLKVISYSKSQSMEMVMKNIRETNTLIRKPSITIQKKSNDKINRDKFNLLMKKCISDMKNKVDKNNIGNEDPLDKINYDKQLYEIEILIDIIKKTGNVPRKQNHTPMVHVPLPREFYELKPLVSFRSASEKAHKNHSNSRQKILKENVSQYMPLDMGYDQYPDIHKKLQKQVVVRNNLENYQDKKSSNKFKEKQSVDEGTTMTSRGKSTFDKGTLTTQRSITNSLLDNIIIKKKHNITEDFVLALEKELEEVKKSQNMLKHKSEKNDNEPNDFPVLREMSTIASYSSHDNRLIPYDSLEIVSNKKGFPQVVNENDLYVVNNGWTVIESPIDPLENSIVVNLRPSLSRQSSSSERLRNKSKSDEAHNSYAQNTYEHPNDTKTDNKYLLDEKSQKTQKEDKHKYQSIQSQNSLQEQHSIEPPELDLTPAHKYNKKLSHVLGLNVDWDNIDLELQEDFNNMEAGLFKQTDSQNRMYESKRTEKLTKSGNMENDDDENNEDKTKKLVKHEDSSVKNDRLKQENEVTLEKQEHKVQTKHVEKSHKETKPKRHRSKSQKRSKKKVPEVHLSDYKGFYVVHTTNDWSFS